MPENTREQTAEKLRAVLEEAMEAVNSYEYGEMGLKYLYTTMVNCDSMAINIIEEAADES